MPDSGMVSISGNQLFFLVCAGDHWFRALTTERWLTSRCS